MLTLYSQRNIKWSLDYLGASKLMVGRFGCTTTAIAMGLTNMGAPITPAQIAAHKDWYTPDGLILWNSLELPGGFKFKKRIYSRVDKVIQDALKDPNSFVILEVNYGQHWVLALSKSWFGNSYKVADPWKGDTCDVLSRYHNITGCAVFSRA